MTEDEVVGWHHQLNGHEFEWTLGDGERQGSLGAAVHGVAKSQTQLSDRTTTLLVEVAFLADPDFGFAHRLEIDFI